MTLRPPAIRLALVLSATVALGGCFGGSGGARDAAPLGAPAAGASAVERINAGTLAILPKNPGKNWVFDAYVSSTSPDVAWSRFWTRALDFSGVAWDNPRTLTLISPRHALMAKHYQRKLGSIAIFHDAKGSEIPRAMIGIANIAHTDLAVVLLQEAVPDGVKFYKVLPPDESYPERLPGAYTLVTDRERKVHVHQIRILGGAAIAFTKADGLDGAYFEKLVTGDSGNPSFVMIRGEPVLIETHTTGGPGAGPFVSAPENFAAINAAMQALSQTHGMPVHQLTTSPAP